MRQKFSKKRTFLIIALLRIGLIHVAVEHVPQFPVLWTVNVNLMLDAFHRQKIRKFLHPVEQKISVG